MGEGRWDRGPGGGVEGARREGRRGRRHRARELLTRPGLVRSLALFLAWLVLAVGLTWAALAALEAWIS